MAGYNGWVMTDFVIEALVLDRRTLGECDTLVDLYSRELGKITARAKSARRITSKLGPYLEPLNLIKARVLGRGGSLGLPTPDPARFQLADALGVAKFPRTAENLRFLALTNALIAASDPDPRLFLTLFEVLSGEHSHPCAELLRVLGYDPAHAECARCGKAPEYFALDDLAFYCGTCAAPLSGLAKMNYYRYN